MHLQINILSYPAFEELRDKKEFIQFGLDQTIFWKDGADIAPERLYEMVASVLFESVVRFISLLIS